MKHVTIRLADAQGVVLEERIVEGEFGSINQCIDMLAGRPPSYSTPEELEALLLEGLEGEATEMTDDDWEELRRLATSRE